MMKNIIFILALCGITFSSTNAQQFFTKSVALFKDGNAFFIKKGTVSTVNKNFTLKDNAIPKATMGSLWFYGVNNPINTIRSLIDTIQTEKETPALTTAQLLYLNKGKKVTLILEKERIEGIVEETAIDYLEARNNGDVINKVPVHQVVIFKTTDGRYMNINENYIQRVEFTEKPIAFYKIPFKKPINVVSISFEKDNVNTALEAMYLQKGLHWSPFYHLQLLDDDKNAQLTLRAEVSNNAEDLKNIDMSFVVGIPNFLFSNTLANLTDFLHKNTSNNDYYRNDAVRASQNIYNNSGTGAGNGGGSGREIEGNQIEGNNVEDLYFYKVPNFSLNKGEKAHVQLFTYPVKYEHIYECNLPEFNTQNYNSYNFSKNEKIKVSHSAKLYNETTNPFTTGSCLITQKKGDIDFPLGQDMLNFTSKKGNTYVKITETPDIRVSHTEKILERSNESTEYWGRSYYKVLIEGQIKLTSYRNKESQMELRHKLVGIAKKSSVDWRFSGQEITLDSPNLVNMLCWDFKLKASEVKEITYQYETYVYR
jgi:Domain of unknown function (DUF4139)